MTLDRQALQDCAAPLGFMGLIFILSSIQGKIDRESLKFLTELDPSYQNLLHIPLFGLLQILWLRSLTKRGVIQKQAVLTSAAVSVAYGIFDEGHQYFVPGRTASVQDMGLNVTGVLLGTLGYLLFKRISLHHERSHADSPRNSR